MFKLSWQWFILFLVIISLSLNLFLFQKLETTLLTLNKLNLYPVYLRRYPTQLEEETTEKNNPQVRVVFFGDSRSEQWTSPQLDGFEFINRGISGETSGQSYLRFRDHINYLKPNIIVMQLGVNDLRMKPLPPMTYQQVINNCQDNIIKIVEEAKSIGATVIVTTVFPLAEGAIPWRWRLTWPTLKEMEQGINSVNQFIRNSEQLQPIYILDAGFLLEANGKVKAQYARDLLHLNRQGYKRLNQALIKQLQSLNSQ
ncbi:MAG: SGNH/GDSL hydrolase family protein [Microcystaceae cyanobacterium]